MVFHARFSVSKKPFLPRAGQEYTVGPAGFRALCARKSRAFLETGSLDPPPAALRLFPCAVSKRVPRLYMENGKEIERSLRLL